MVEIRELENIISRIDGIKAVKVVGDDDKIKEIHVIASESKNPKQVVRDIETAVYALTGFKLDRKVVSVAQISGEVAKKRRIALVEMEKILDGLKVKVHVSIKVNGEDYEGEAEGPNTSTALPLVIGNAVVNAVGIDELAISVDDLQTARVFNKEYVMCHVTCGDGKNEWELIGIAPKGEDFERSCALAVIDALEKVI